MAKLDIGLARQIPTGENAEKPDLWDSIVLAHKFYDKAQKEARTTTNTKLERALMVYASAILVLEGNLQVALERIAALEEKQNVMSKAVTRMMMDAASE